MLKNQLFTKKVPFLFCQFKKISYLCTKKQIKGDKDMSTPSRIILKVHKEDVGRKIKFDPTKLPIPLKEWIETDENGKVWLDQRGKDLCRVVTLKGGYIGIYCHWDGSFDGVGETLKEHFNDYETALNLLVGGFCSGIASGHVAHYANRIGDKWAEIKPIQGNIDKLRDNIYGQYEYVFENDKWVSREC